MRTGFAVVLILLLTATCWMLTTLPLTSTPVVPTEGELGLAAGLGIGVVVMLWVAFELETAKRRLGPGAA